MRKTVTVFACLVILAGLTACGGGGSSRLPSPSVSVSSVSISPGTVSLDVNDAAKTVQFTASVRMSNGTTTTSVTWKANVGTITANGLFTRPDVVGPCTITATSTADSTKSATATVTVYNSIVDAGFSWFKQYVPAGGGSAEGKAVVVTTQGIVFGVDSTLQNAADSLATLVLYDNNGNQLKEWRSTIPSSITAMAYDAETNTVFVTGRKGSESNPSEQETLLLIVSAADLTVTDKSFQVVDQNQSVGRDIVVWENKIIVAAFSAYNLCWTKLTGGGFCTKDFAGIFDFQGNLLNGWVPSEWPVASNCRGSISSIMAPASSPTSLWFAGSVVCGGISNDNYINRIEINDYSADLYTIHQAQGYGAGNYAKILWGEAVNGIDSRITFGTSKQDRINLSGYQSVSDPATLSLGPISWDGNNAASGSVSIFKSMVLDKDAAGALTVGSLSATDNSGGTVGGIASLALYAKDAAIPGEVRWGKRFNVLPFTWTITSLNGVVYANPDNPNDPGNLKVILIGTGTNGVSANPLAVIGKSRYAYTTSTTSPF